MHSLNQDIMTRAIPLNVAMLLLSLGAPLFAGEAASSDRPNVLMIIADDLNDWIGCLNGHPDVKTLGREALFWHCPDYNTYPSSMPSSVIRRGSWKLIETFDPAGVELYSLAEDLSETRNLALERTDLVKELRDNVHAWRLDVGAEMMRPNPDYDPAAPPPVKAKKRARKGTGQ